ncbi:MAG: exopolyphosphatase [Desulfamplus sp.]|nr:exopolyphosphatase [Desulfamplus sp.]MBF0411130.1 exopolyphosphatase [Desulfamplus sp.]
MRIVTRPDFDGIVCAVIILEALQTEMPIIWVEPGQVQNGSADIQPGDIMANLPFNERCSVWFDHHVSNSSDRKIEGAFKIAPSAAGVVYEYYKEQGKLSRNFDELIKETDMIDAAILSMDQVLHPENYPFILLSMTVKNRAQSEHIYWERLIKLLRHKSIDEILTDIEVKKRCDQVINENMVYADILRKYTLTHGHLSVTDFRTLERAPSGNRFLTYSLFPDSVASIKIRYDDNDKDIVLVSIGKSIFNDGLNINIGKLLAKYGGGGHAGAGGCSMKASDAQKNINEIIDIMLRHIS